MTAKGAQALSGDVTDAAACILVVEDDPNVRDLYATLLRDEGYRVETAIDGQDGLHQLAHSPSLIVLDLMMPIMDGREFLRRLRSIESHRATPVLVVSAVQEGATIHGAQAVMRKPFAMDELLGRIAALLVASDELTG